jgi:FSR family fosmidomycin resistance protein-like MFS transporter
MEEPRSKDSVSLLAYLASTHFIIHVYTQLLPVLLLPLMEELGVSLVQVSLLASIPRLINVVAYIPIGAAADRRPALILTVSFIVTAVGSLLIPVSRSLYPILAGFALLSLGSTLYHPPSLKLASEFDSKKVSLAMGIHNAGANLGFAAGPLLLGLLMPVWGWRVSFLIWGPITLLMAVVSHIYTGRRFGSETMERGERTGLRQGFRSLFTAGYITVAAMSVLAEAVFNILFTFTPTYFTLERGMSYSLASIVAGLGPLTGLAGSFVGGLSGDRLGKYRTGLVILVLMTVLLVVFPYSPSLLSLAVAYALYRCLQAAFMPLMNAMIASHSDAESRSLAFSVNFVIVSLVGSFVPTATSFLIEAHGTPVIFPISIIAMVPTIGLILLLRRMSGAK